MKKFILVLTLAAMAPLSAAAIADRARAQEPGAGCEGAPPTAVLTLPKPANRWMRIVCTETGHTVAPVSGDSWQIIHDSRPFSISAADDGGTATGRHISYFVSARVERLNKANAGAVRARYASNADIALPDTVRAIYAVYFLSNLGRRDTIYVFLDKERPVAGLACVGNCDHVVIATVTHAEVEPAPQ